jgi:antitoxin component of RelBE/YafQ-DinJ toxin-antitoxin module
VLATMGLTVSDAVRLCHRVARDACRSTADPQ